LWASSLNEESLLASDGFELSHSIAERIEANEIGLLSRGNATALRLSLYGQHLLQRMDLPAIRRARNNFRAALNIEPENIAAITGIARSFVREEIIAARSDDRLLEEGRNLAARAIALRPDDYRGYQTLGIVNLYSHRFDSCLDYLYHAQRLSPSIPYLSYDLSDALVYDGQHAEAIRETEKAKSTLKFHTDAGRWLVAGAKYLQGDYRAAANELAEMQDPTAASRFRAGVHAMLGENDAAAAYVHDAMEFNPDFNARRWVSVSPYRRREDREHSSTGLLSAGFK
jgi:cytochrome c-type biogenesis protein CcmH/NrfG